MGYQHSAAVYEQFTVAELPDASYQLLQQPGMDCILARCCAASGAAVLLAVSVCATLVVKHVRSVPLPAGDAVHVLLLCAVHWYYSVTDLKRDFGEITDYQVKDATGSNQTVVQVDERFSQSNRLSQRKRHVEAH